LKTSVFRLFISAALLAGAPSSFGAAATPSPAPRAAVTLSATTPLEWSVRMADSEIKRSGKKLYAAPAGDGWWDYTTGLYADALIKLSDDTGSPAYEKNAEATIGSFINPDGTIIDYEKKRKPKPGASPKPTPDEGLPVVKIPYSLDDVQSGVAVLKLYGITHEARYRGAADILREQLRKHPRIPEGGFWHKAIYPNQMWLDGLYMGEPFYANYAATFNEPADFDDIAKQFTLIGEHTYDAKTGLFYHGWDESKKQRWANPQTGASPSFWGRAIGWYVMALVDVLDTMPANHPQRPALIALLQEAGAGLLKNQDAKTGVWWQVTDKGGQPHNYLEASSSCMFVYALAKGVNHGYLPKADIPAIRAGYQGILHQFITVDADGTSISLNHICKVAGLDKRRQGSYKYYTEEEPIVSNDLKGVGPFITAGMECQKLFGGETFPQ
jgi:unsaturated rhamnogalacturonyl hydrolase